MIIGFDEVGRGALAGPVYTGATLLTKEYPKYTFDFTPDQECYKDFEDLKNVKDSKRLKPQIRKQIFKVAGDRVIKNTVLSASNKLIDQFGIGVCLSHLLIISIQQLNNFEKIEVIADGKIKLLERLDQELTKKIIEENNIKKELYLDFYYKIKDTSLFSENTSKINIIRENKADDKYLSVAIASNLAKVTRDNIMEKLHKEYPNYSWQTNKGYATKEHREAIRKTPNNKYLRKTWLKNILN